jgi:preprotein translocase SecE subunit
VDFLIATDSEMKKVNWTTRKELIGSTKVVIFFVLLIAALLFTLDLVFGYFFQLIKVLEFGPFQ